MDRPCHMHRRHAQRNLLHHSGRFPEGQLPLPVDFGLQALTRHILHRQIDLIPHLPRLEHLHHMRMAHRRHLLCLHLEALAELLRIVRVGHAVGADHLQGYHPVQPFLPGPVDHPHAAPAQYLQAAEPGDLWGQGSPLAQQLADVGAQGGERGHQLLQIHLLAELLTPVDLGVDQGQQGLTHLGQVGKGGEVPGGADSLTPPQAHLQVDLQ